MREGMSYTQVTNVTAFIIMLENVAIYRHWFRIVSYSQSSCRYLNIYIFPHQQQLFSLSTHMWHTFKESNRALAGRLSCF